MMVGIKVELMEIQIMTVQGWASLIHMDFQVEGEIIMKISLREILTRTMC